MQTNLVSDSDSDYLPSPRQILCHNIVAAHNGQSFLLDVIAAEHQTQLFFTHVFAGLAGVLGVDTHNLNQASLIETLSADVFDVLSAAKKIAYRRTSARLDPTTSSPYENFSHDTLREFVGQSYATLAHFVGCFGTSPEVLKLTKIKSTLSSYFNTRYGTAIFLIESFPLSGNETIHFINREQYYSTLEDEGADALV